MLGGAREGVLERFVFGSVPEAVASRVEQFTITCQRDVGAASRPGRLFT